MLVEAPLCVRVRLGHAPWKTGARADSGRRFTVLTSPAGGTDVVAIRSLVSFTSLLPTTQACSRGSGTHLSQGAFVLLLLGVCWIKVKKDCYSLDINKEKTHHHQRETYTWVKSDDVAGITTERISALLRPAAPRGPGRVPGSYRRPGLFPGLPPRPWRPATAFSLCNEGPSVTRPPGLPSPSPSRFRGHTSALGGVAR